MTNDDIKRLALRHGFTERMQPDGAMDLNPSVYDFALAIGLECAAIGDRATYQGNVVSEAIRYSLSHPA